MIEISRQTWKACASGTLLWEQWNGDYIVYNSHSGETHFLNELAAMALKSLEEVPCNAEQLAKTMAMRDSIAADLDTPDMQRLIEEFDSLGLIEPHPS